VVTVNAELQYVGEHERIEDLYVRGTTEIQYQYIASYLSEDHCYAFTEAASADLVRGIDVWDDAP
jgi:hypothetical protein